MLRVTLQALKADDGLMCESVSGMDDQVDALQRAGEAKERVTARRLNQGKRSTMQISEIQLNMLQDLKRIKTPGVGGAS